MVAAMTLAFVPGKPGPGSHCVAHWAVALSETVLLTREKSRTAKAAEGSAGEGRETMGHPRGWRVSESIRMIPRCRLQLLWLRTIVGATFYQQLIPIEIDASLQWLAVTPTDALQLVVGL